MKKILLIEDNEAIRENTEILRLAEYEVVVSENGKRGIEVAKKFSPDLVICDIMMPQLDGYGVLSAIQENGALHNTPFIFLTARSGGVDIRKGMDAGADDFITKPSWEKNCFIQLKVA
ncbi:MAG: response regulator [Saprospiraceae bacterium]